MTHARLLVIQPAAHGPVGKLGDWLVEAGAELHTVRPAEQPLPETLAGYHGVVCLGGGMGALDDAAHPWLADVRRTLATAATSRTPVLAICLGAQLLAVATGGVVEVGAEGPEVGPALVAKRDLGWTDPLFAELPLMPDVLQFHSDTVVRLPPGTDLLAAGTGYPHQAFRVGTCAYGLQFHIETTAEIVLSWAASNPRVAGAAPRGSLEPDRLAALHDEIEETWRPFAARFVRLAAGELDRAASNRSKLPLI